MERHDAGPAQPAEHEHHTGASVRTYLAIGVLLAVLTYVELQIPTMLAADRPLMIGSLLVAAFLKAGLVALFYMHLKFDSRVYTGIMVLALLLITYFLWLLTY
jgi:cytochrome c oxidase subunit 4